MDGRARAELRRISRALTGKAPHRLEVALAVASHPSRSFALRDISALLPEDEVGHSHNVSRNLKAFVDAGFLGQVAPGGPYERIDSPFWIFVVELWDYISTREQRSVAGTGS